MGYMGIYDGMIGNVIVGNLLVPNLTGGGGGQNPWKYKLYSGALIYPNYQLF